MIKHHIYFDGKVQSLGTREVQCESYVGGNRDFTIGIVEPGEYNFGVAEREEWITGITGELRINGHLLPNGRVIVIRRGELILIRAEKTSSYLCVYHDYLSSD